MLDQGLGVKAVFLGMLGLGCFFLVSSGGAEIKIFRSIGAQTTEALAKGSSYGNLEVQGTTATVSAALPLNVGVGDVFQYDSNYDMTIDQVAFISQRIDATHYMVQNATGGTPVPTNIANLNWSIFRAYTSLALAATGTENTGVTTTVRDFDPWTSNNLTSVGRSWHLACYSSPNPDDASANFSSWVTNATCRLHIFTPVTSNEVGVSQRHTGMWNTSGYCMKTLSAPCLRLGGGTMMVEGLQFNLPTVTGNDNYLVEIVGAGMQEITISESIFSGSTSAFTGHFGVGLTASGATQLNFWNNIVYDFVKSSIGINVGGIRAASLPSTVNVYNNTLVNCSTGIWAQMGAVKAINNLTKACSPGFDGTFDPISDYNISNNSGDAPGPNSQNLVFVLFVDQSGKDFHLAPLDVIARDHGVMLGQVSSDIDRQLRSGNWDVGADEVLPLGTPTSTMTPTPSQTVGYSPTCTVSPTPFALHTATLTRTPLIVIGTPVPLNGTPTPTPTVASHQVPLLTTTPTPRAVENPAPWFVTHNVLRGADINRGMTVVVRSEHEQHVLIQFRDQQGRKVCTLADQMIPAGRFQTVWRGVDQDGRAVRSGVYLMYIKADTFEGKCKIAVIR